MSFKFFLSFLLVAISTIQCNQAPPAKQVKSPLPADYLLKKFAVKFDSREDSLFLRFIDSVHNSLRPHTDSIFTYVWNRTFRRRILFWWRTGNHNETLIYETKPHADVVNDTLLEHYVFVKRETDSINRFISFPELVAARTSIFDPLPPRHGNAPHSAPHCFIWNFADSIDIFIVEDRDLLSETRNHTAHKLTGPTLCKYVFKE